MLYNWLQASEIEQMSLESDSDLLSQLEDETAAHDMLLFSIVLAYTNFYTRFK